MAYQIQVTPFNPRQSDPMDQLGRLLQLKGARGQEILQQQRIEQNELQLSSQKRLEADRQKIMEAQRQAAGDPSKWLPMLQGQIAPETYSALVQQDAETRQKLASADSAERTSLQAKNSQFLALIEQAKNLPDESYAQQWPQIVTAAERIHPGTTQQYGLSPDQPVPKDKLAQFELGMLTADQYFKQANEVADQNEKRRHNQAMENKKTPGVDIPFTKEVADQKAEIARAGRAPDKDPAEIQEYNLAVRQGFKGSFLDWKKESGTRPTQDFTQERQLRSDLFKEIKNYPNLVDQVNRIEAGAKEPTAAGDIAILFNFMKMLDEGSVVRESEFATAANAGSLLDRAKAALSKVQNGQRLSADQRKDFVSTAKKLFNAISPRYEKIIEGYAETAKGYGLDPKKVLAGTGSTSKPGGSSDGSWGAKFGGVPH